MEKQTKSTKLIVSIRSLKVTCLGYGMQCYAFFNYLVKRIIEDRLTVVASSLAYTTLLSLVPLITVVFSVMSAFPIFESWQHSVEEFLYTNLVPDATGTIKDYVQDFVANTGKMTSIGLGALFMVALLLISTIDKHINSIWRCKIDRHFFISFSVYWMILTFGPLFIAISLGISSYIFSLSFLSEPSVVSGSVLLLKAVPALLGVLGLFVMYVVIPHRKVPFSYALIGACISASLFEVMKRLFTWYIVKFPSYEVIYGALATIPILLVWIYLCWLIVLLGAEITASLTEFNQVSNESNPAKLAEKML